MTMAGEAQSLRLCQAKDTSLYTTEALKRLFQADVGAGLALPVFMRVQRRVFGRGKPLPYNPLFHSA